MMTLSFRFFLPTAFSQVFVYSEGGGVPRPGSRWAEVPQPGLSPRQGSTPVRSYSQMGGGGYPNQGGGTPWPELDGVPHIINWMGIAPLLQERDMPGQVIRLCRGRYASCGFPQEDFLV